MSNVDWVNAGGGGAVVSPAVLRPAETAAERKMERRPAMAFVALSVFYFAVVAILSSFKLLWLDELITLHLARLGGASAIWQALAQGADPNPPLTYLLVHWCRAAFGDHEFVYRLPAIVGYWMGTLSLFLYLKRRLPATWALGGAMLSMTMGAFEYSYESRSYGIFYGLAMLAFLGWSRTVDARSSGNVRRFALLGMIVALGAGISTNYFAVLAFFPIAAGELARTFARARAIPHLFLVRDKAHRFRLLRSIDLRIWIGLAVAGSTLLIYRSLISHAIAQFGPYAWNKVSLDQVTDSYTQMVEVVLYPILALFVLGIGVYFMAPRVNRLCCDCRNSLFPGWMAPLFRRRRARFAVPVHEAVGILFFMMYPILGYVVASIRGGMLSPRFVIPVCFGFAMAAALVAHWIFGNMRGAGLVLLGIATAWFMCRESVVGYWYEEQKQCLYKVLDRLPQAAAQVDPDGPVVIPDPLLVLTFQHYAPAEVASRVVFPVDFPAIRFYRHDDSPEENLWAGRKWLFTVAIVPLAAFQNSAGRYLIIAGDGNWLLEDLAHHHYAFERLPINTRAGAMGGFTPLARGTPGFYSAAGEAALTYVLPRLEMPVPFRAGDNLPNTRWFDPDGVRQ